MRGGPHLDAPEALRSACLDPTGAVEEFPFGPQTSVFKVEGKMFALSALAGEPLEVSLKCEPDLAEQLRDSYPAIRAGYHLNKRHWNTVTLDGSLPDEMVLGMIEDSYDLVVAGLSRAKRDGLGWAPQRLALLAVDRPLQLVLVHRRATLDAQLPGLVVELVAGAALLAVRAGAVPAAAARRHVLR